MGFSDRLVVEPMQMPVVSGCESLRHVLHERREYVFAVFEVELDVRPRLVELRRFDDYRNLEVEVIERIYLELLQRPVAVVSEVLAGVQRVGIVLLALDELYDVEAVALIDGEAFSAFCARFCLGVEFSVHRLSVLDVRLRKDKKRPDQRYVVYYHVGFLV